ncbi:MAG: hypothetical protein HRU46_12875, partial [Verrucomicrobiales bacterium]|nr:hypothetical protein [Verrucomicrobiales bacterium]
MKTSPFATSVITSILISLTANSLNAEDWPNWRGPDYSGSRAGESCPTRWTPDTLEWKAPLPGSELLFLQYTEIEFISPHLTG